uniref:Uncharacterized protein n=1 Tax=Panagrolaimus sp. ES5 TaxID=591445 RepID=A0AC34GHN0_9BILA
MPPNTSGSIRQALGRARSNAVKHTDRCKELFTAHPPPWNNDISLDMTGILDLMEKDVKNLDELWEKWEKFTDRIQNDDDHEKEEKLFNEWRDNDLYMDAMDLLVEYIAKAKKAIEISDAYIDRVSSATTQKGESNLGDDLRETAKKNAVLD